MKTRSPRKTDPWLSPRQAAELLLDHKTFPRTTLEIRTLQKQICTACAELQLSELERWCRRRSHLGKAYLEAVVNA